MNYVKVPWKYEGEIHVRPVARGIILEDYEHMGETMWELEEVLPVGNFIAQIKILPLNYRAKRQNVDVARCASGVECRLPLGAFEILTTGEARELAELLREAVG